MKVIYKWLGFSATLDDSWHLSCLSQTLVSRTFMHTVTAEAFICVMWHTRSQFSCTLWQTSWKDIIISNIEMHGSCKQNACQQLACQLRVVGGEAAQSSNGGSLQLQKQECKEGSEPRPTGKSRVTICETQHATGLGHEKFHAIIHMNLKTKKCVHTERHGIWQQNNGRWRGTTINRNIHCGIITHLCHKIQHLHKGKWT